MKYSAALFLIIIFSLTAAAQKTKTQAKTAKSQTKAKLTVNKIAAKKTGSEKEDFEKAIALTDATQRITALKAFIEDFPKSDEKIRARELIVSARAELADAKLQAGETEKGIELFKLAVKDAPKPMSEKLFADVIMQFPTNIFLRGGRGAAFDIAEMIEEKAEGDAKQLLGLAAFYLGIESASAARRLANKAIEIETASESEKSNLPVAYQTLGLANRLGFQLEDAANAYTKALELDAESVVSKRSLAEMKRAVGKFDEAIALYRELIAKDENDLAAKTGLTLSLFDAGRRGEAEIEMTKTLESGANNLPLLVGAAYWYAAKNEGAKAIELAQQALKTEPRYTWAYIALGRGLMAQKMPLEAERVLLTARNYGSFPTLDYEIAAARLQSGFYREAADELRKNFAVKNGTLETKLGGRITVEAEDFLKLLMLERQASIFAPTAADTADAAQKLKSLLTFSQELNSPNEDLEAITTAAEEFVKGDDKMKIHRQLFVAARLLDKRKALPKILEMTQAAVSGVDSALDVPNPSAAVMADELYETRTLAMSRNEILLVPEVPRQTLSVILRGRIEEIAGWTLYQQAKTDEAVVRLKRAVSVLPEKSSWWRSSVWRLGTALEAEGKQKEALDNYLKAYAGSEQPDAAKYLVIESLYQKLNGSTEGLEQKIGLKPVGADTTIAKAMAESNPEPIKTTDTNQEIKSIAESENPSSALPIPKSADETSAQTNTKITPTPETEKSLPDEPEKTTSATNQIPAEPKSEEPEVTITQPENTAQPETPPEPDEISAVPETLPSPEPEVEENPPVEDNSAQKARETPTPENLWETEKKTESVSIPESTTPPEVLKTDGNPPVRAIKTPETETKPEVSAVSQIEEVLLNDTEKIKTPPETELSAAPKPKTESPPAETQTKKSEKLSVVVTDNTQPKPLKNRAKNSEKNLPEKDTDSQSVFEPVIINLPKSEDAGKPKPRRIILENPPVFKKERTEPPQSKNNAEQNAETQEKAVNSDGSSATRLRVVIEDKLKNLPSAAENPQCRISVSQENISLINNGGSIGILVELEGGATIEELNVVLSSPRDITAIREKELGSNAGRGFFVIKSISDKKGVYTVTIESPCGKKEIQVRVR